MVSKAYQVWRQPGKIHISITMAGIGSRDLKIAPKIFPLTLFSRGDFYSAGERKTAGFPPPP
jgi:hypothetical protein